MSHTVRMAIEIRNPIAFADACRELGGEVIGHGEHRLFQPGTIDGFAVKLPKWLYPIVATSDGLKFDNYNGAWGSQSSLDKLVERYAIHAARCAAVEQGWQTEDQADGSLVIFHPDGGTVTVTPKGQVTAACFEGRSCTEVTAPIENALGKTSEQTLTPEYFIERQALRRRE